MDTVQAAPAEERFRYGWVRGDGSAAFVVAVLLSSRAVERWGLEVIILLNAVMLATAAVLALTLPALRRVASRAERKRPV